MLTHFHQSPIVKKLQVINLLIVGLITLLTIISLCFYMYITLRDNYRENSTTLTSLLAESVTSALLFGDKKAAQETLAGLRTVDYVTHAELYDKGGSLFASYAKDTRAFVAAANFDPRGYQQDIRFGNLTLDSAFPVRSIVSGSEQIGTITMQIDLTDAYVHLGYQVAALLLIGLLGAALVSAALSKLQRSITVPLLSLTETMRKITNGGGLSAKKSAL